jgi:hypothetical protein
MAYGIKYRLEFSDVLGNGKKIEILKDGYSGAVLPLVGTADPVSIKWEGDDDFYSPIIGSTCTLNLFVTDEVQYENFYAFDEQEFQVKIYYKSISNNWALYWAGFIVTDSYKQAMAAPPYQISLQAHDGIGLLSTQFMEIRNTDLLKFTSSEPSRTIAQNLIQDAISKTNLDLYVYISLNLFSDLSNNQVELQNGGNGFPKYDDELQIIDCKTFIENTLRGFNARIFQAQGRWYIVSNSEYIDHDFFDDQADGTIASNIRDAETKMLQQNKSESPEFRIYNTSGSYISSTTEDIFLETKTDLTPLGNDLVVEYLPPARIVKNTENFSVYNLQLNSLISDPTFELPTSAWSITSGRASIGEYPYLISGKKSARTNLSVGSTSTFSQMLSTGTGERDWAANTKIKLDFNYYLDGTLSSSALPFAILYQVSISYEVNTIPQTNYFNVETQGWESAPVTNVETIEDANEFSSFSANIVSFATYRPDASMSVRIGLPYKASGTSFSYFYMDDVTFGFERTLADNLISTRERTVNSNKLESEYVPHKKNYNLIRARDKGSSQTPTAQDTITQQKMNDYRSHVSRYEGTFYNNNLTPVSPKNKIWVNFSEKFVTATFTSSNTTFLASGDVDVVNDKIGWYVTGGSITTPVKITNITSGAPPYYTLDTAISFSSGDEFALSSFNAVKLPVSNEYPTHEPVSCMIDSMEYNVKANTVSVVMHVPNQDDDVSSTFKETSKK